MRLLRLWLSLAAIGAGQIGCAQPAVNLTPEAAVQACEAPTTLALRAREPAFQSLVLEPAATTRVEKRAAYVGHQPLALVVAGHGTATQDGSTGSDVSYLCLIAPSGDAVFVDVTTRNGGTILAECSGNTAEPSRLACLSDLLRQAELGLAEAEAKAVVRARTGTPRTKRAEVEEPVATSIGAWRVYRDAECDRQRDADLQHSTDLYQACRVGLTRERVGQLGS
ncbi:MAG: lysozyme inhibitor LprI family protein [Geminicoccaceae bacterium]